jgi:hypothetical protein
MPFARGAHQLRLAGRAAARTGALCAAPAARRPAADACHAGLRLQCGGLIALQAASAGEGADVHSLVGLAHERHGSLTELPWDRLVPALAAWQPPRRHARSGPGCTPAALATLVQAVQTNCHIADARHAADLTLCTYLLQMREFYRWEQGLPLGAQPAARSHRHLDRRARSTLARAGRSRTADPARDGRLSARAGPFRRGHHQPQLQPTVWSTARAWWGRTGRCSSWPSTQDA